MRYSASGRGQYKAMSCTQHRELILEKYTFL